MKPSLRLFVNGKEESVLFSKFPAGETLVRIDSVGSVLLTRAHIRCDFKDNGDLINLLMLTDAVRRNWRSVSIELVMNYLPYARQDRVCNYGESLSVKVIADLINSQNYSQVYCKDLHSDVSSALINNLQHADMVLAAVGLATFHPNAILVSPDAGANKKVLNFAKHYRYKEVVRADKTRNVLTGEIADTEVYSEHVGNRDFLILDDICDGGRTFVELAKELKKLTNGKIYLYVTHGIFSKDADIFDGLIDRIYTANLIGSPHSLIKEI